MPQPLDYAYIPQYGVEPYLDTVDGGARVTGDNLLVTLWTSEDKGGVPPAPYVLFNSIVRPGTINSDEPANIRSGYEKTFHSRCSAKFYFGPNEAFVWPLCAVLNPPEEYKQLLVNAVRYVGDNASDPADLANYEVSKSLQACVAWQLPNLGSSINAFNYTRSPSSIEAMFSEYIPLSPTGNSASRILPFLRTNGADGQTPEFFDTTTVAGVQAMIAAVNRGDFYVAALLVNIGEDAAFVEIRWPHSTARG